MEINNTLKKVLSQKNITDENGISFEEKLEIIKGLVSEKVANTLKKEIIIGALAENKKMTATLNYGEFENGDKINSFLKILGAENIKITDKSYTAKDYGGGSDFYEKPTIVEFTIPEPKKQDYDCFEYKM